MGGCQGYGVGGARGIWVWLEKSRMRDPYGDENVLYLDVSVPMCWLYYRVARCYQLETQRAHHGKKTAH